MAKKSYEGSGRFTDVNIGYSVDTENRRTTEQILKDMEKDGAEVIRVPKKPPEAF
jgi:hypothetical protein